MQFIFQNSSKQKISKNEDGIPIESRMTGESKLQLLLWKSVKHLQNYYRIEVRTNEERRKGMMRKKRPNVAYLRIGDTSF